MQKPIYIFLLVLFLASCEKLVTEVDPPQTAEQVVMFAFISPEAEYTRVDLSLSSPVFNGDKRGGEIRIISNAGVSITDQLGNSAALVYSDSAKAYIISASGYQVVAGRTYTVKAVANGKTVSGICRVPSGLVSFTEATSKKVSGSFGEESYKYAFKFNDLPGKGNYYRVSVDLVQNDPEGGFSYNLDNAVFTDEKNDGRQFNGTGDSYDDGKGGAGGPVMIMSLLNTDIHYYEYHRRRLAYSGDDPFSEPFQQYSNVNGGIGVIAAYRKTSVDVSVQ